MKLKKKSHIKILTKARGQKKKRKSNMKGEKQMKG
jgi:hypothetical protein